MAACFSHGGSYALPVVHVLSKIPRLTECLINLAQPDDIKMKHVSLPDDFDEKQTLSEVQLKEIKEAEIVVCDAVLLAKTYKLMPNLKWAHCTWAGLDPLFKAISKEPSFVITRHCSETFSKLMSEYVVCHILNCERQSKLCWKSQQSKTWLSAERFKYRCLNEITVGTLGVGNMASAVAKFLKERGTTVLGYAKHPRSHNDLFDKISTNLEDILSECDYICNTLPDTPLTQGMLNNSILQKCTKKPVFINVGRGNIISENELVQALRAGWLSEAILDVFENEPLPESSQLWDMEQVTITPHVSAISRPEHVAEGFFENLTSYLGGQGLKSVLNWSAGY